MEDRTSQSPGDAHRGQLFSVVSGSQNVWTGSAGCSFCPEWVTVSLRFRGTGFCHGSVDLLFTGAETLEDLDVQWNQTGGVDNTYLQQPSGTGGSWCL